MQNPLSLYLSLYMHIYIYIYIYIYVGKSERERETGGESERVWKKYELCDLTDTDKLDQEIDKKCYAVGMSVGSSMLKWVSIFFPLLLSAFHEQQFHVYFVIHLLMFW